MVDEGGENERLAHDDSTIDTRGAEERSRGPVRRVPDPSGRPADRCSGGGAHGGCWVGAVPLRTEPRGTGSIGWVTPWPGGRARRRGRAELPWLHHPTRRLPRSRNAITVTEIGSLWKRSHHRCSSPSHPCRPAGAVTRSGRGRFTRGGGRIATRRTSGRSHRPVRHRNSGGGADGHRGDQPHRPGHPVRRARRADLGTAGAAARDRRDRRRGRRHADRPRGQLRQEVGRRAGRPPGRPGPGGRQRRGRAARPTAPSAPTPTWPPRPATGWSGTRSCPSRSSRSPSRPAG